MLRLTNGVMMENSLLKSRRNTSQLNTLRKKQRNKKKKERLGFKRERMEKKLKSQLLQLKPVRASLLFMSFHP